MTIFLWLVVFVICLVTLVKSADVFTENSEKMGIAFGLSSFIIGATIVAIGTSLPELVSAIFAVVDAGSTEFVADTIVGSNIANIVLVFGIGAIIARGLKVETSLIDVDLPFFFLSMGLYTYFAYDGIVSRAEGILLLALFIIFIIYNTKSGSSPEELKEDHEELKDLSAEYGKEGKHIKGRGGAPIGKYLGFIVLSGAAVAVSAKYLITSVLTLSALLGISSSLLTLIFVALGTSLPEVLTAVSAIRRGNHGIAIGNVMGSNTFNLLLIGGGPALIYDLAVSPLVLSTALPFLVLVTFAGIFVVFDNKIRFWEGVAMLFLYVVFLGKITGLV